MRRQVLAAFVKALKNVILNPRSRKRMAIAARNLIFSKYSWHTIAADIVAEYEKVTCKPYGATT